MIDLLRAAAVHSPEHPALVSERATLTYADLVRLAETAAASLTGRGLGRVAVLDSRPEIVWPLLAAGSLGGTEVCVYPTAATPDTVERLRARLDHDVIITTQDLPGALDPAELLAAAARWSEPPAASRTLLVLTTGTSGDPKAARHDWDRVLRVTQRIVPSPEHRWLLAYALNQFGGLQILLHVSAARASLIAGESFQPRDALAAMRRWDVTHASGTPTFWRFVLAEIRADGRPVPSLRQITLSGEAIPDALIPKLRATFPNANYSQIYAATEIGQGITVRDGEPGLPIEFLQATGDLQFRVVDGELHVRSAAAMLGYVGAESTPAPDWRATGDLVEIVGERILFRGRTTEVINVGGVKVHPLPIEERAGRVDGVALAHAYGRPNAMVGHIVALDVVPHVGADTDAIRTAIREACADLPPASQPRSIKFVDTIATGGNKVARRGPA